MSIQIRTKLFISQALEDYGIVLLLEKNPDMKVKKLLNLVIFITKRTGYEKPDLHVCYRRIRGFYLRDLQESELLLSTS